MEQVLPGRQWLVPMGRGRRGNGEGRRIWCKYCVHMYVNGKWYLFKLFQEWEKEEMKENGEGGNSNMMYWIDSKNFYKYYNESPLSTTQKKDTGF
jgi:hypothetical protein